MPNTVRELANKKLLAANSLVNLAGLGIPLFLGLIALPPLIATIGVERLGLLTLSWAVIGYFTLFDLGIGRAITHRVAELLAANRTEAIRPLMWSGVSLMAGLAILAASALALMVPWLVGSVMKVPLHLVDETTRAGYALCMTVPFVVTAAGMRGALEAAQRFKVVAAIRVFFAFTALFGPLFVSAHSVSIFDLTLVVCLGRILAWIFLLRGITDCFPGVLKNPAVSRSSIANLLPFGLWMTVSNILSPLLVNLDRFILASTLSLSAVAFYSTPLDVVTKFLVIPAAVSGVLFSALSACFAQNSSHGTTIYSLAARAVWVGLFPLVLIVVLFAKELMALWISEEFSENSYLIAQIIAIGVIINGMAHLPFAAIQANKRPDVTALLHSAELVPFVIVMLLLIETFGIEGAAIAWTLRVSVDFAALSFLAARLTPITLGLTRVEILMLLVMSAGLFIGIGVAASEVRAFLLVTELLFLVIFAYMTWQRLRAFEK